MTETRISENVMISVLLNHFFMFTESKCGKNARINLSITNKAKAKGKRISPISIFMLSFFIVSFFDSIGMGFLWISSLLWQHTHPHAVIKTSIANINQFSDEFAMNVISYHFVNGYNGKRDNGVS